MKRKLSPADLAEANHLTRQIEAYEVLIDEAETTAEAERYEKTQDELRARRNELIW